MDQRMRNDLDNYITGHYGEDQFAKHDDDEEFTDVLCGCGWGEMGVNLSSVPARCPMCGHQFIKEDGE
jgi:hypothetical protein